MVSVRRLAVLALAVIASGSAAAYVQHIRHFTPAESSAESVERLAFILSKSIGNREGPTRFYVRDLSATLIVDPKSDLPTPKLLAEPGGLTLSFEADDIAWSIESEGCRRNDKLVNAEWLFCQVGEAKEGFALEPKSTGGAPAFALHFGRLWKDSKNQLSIPVTNGESAALFMSEKFQEDVVNRFIVADESRDLVTIEFSDSPPPSK